MPYRKELLVNNQVYHVLNRGLDKRPVFNDERDYERFIKTLSYYLRADSSLPRISFLSKYKLDELLSQPIQTKMVDVICYCLMPNHFHLILKQVTDNGISNYLRKITDSYTRYHNLKQKRNGALFEGSFKAIRVEDDEQLVHLSRYIHLNPVSSFLVEDFSVYKWSSYNAYVNIQSPLPVPLNPEIVMDKFRSPKQYQNFVLDQKDYARKLEIIKHLTLEKTSNFPDV